MSEIKIVKRMVFFGKRFWVVLGLGLIFLAAWLGRDLAADMASNANAPAWVQAIGSIFAIIAAIGVAMWERYSSRRSDLQKDRSDYLKERRKSAHLISTMGGNLNAALLMFTAEGDKSLWKVRMSRIFFQGELEMNREISTNSLTRDEMKYMYEIRLIALQIFEALVHAESSQYADEKGNLYVNDRSYEFLLKVLNDHSGNIKKIMESIKKDWSKNTAGGSKDEISI